MNALYLTLFVSLVLAGLGVVLFLHSVVHKDRDHVDRLALMPLEADDTAATPSNSNPTPGPDEQAGPEPTNP